MHKDLFYNEQLSVWPLHINYYFYFTVTIITCQILLLHNSYHYYLMATSNCKQYQFIGFNSILITEN